MKTVKVSKNILIALLIGIALYFLIPMGMGLTPVGRSVLILTIPTVYLWVTEQLAWPSLLFVGGMIVCGLDATSILASSWGNHLIPTLIASLALTTVLEETGATEYIASWFYTRRIVEGRPYVFIFMLLLAHFAMSLVMNCEATVILFINITQAFLRKMGYKKGDKFYTMMMLGVLWVGATCEVATPLGHPQPMLMLGVVNTMFGLNVTIADWIKVGIPFCMVMFALVMLILRFCGMDVSRLKELNIEEIRKNRAPLTAEGKVAAGAFLLVLIAWIMPGLGKLISPTLGELFNQWTMAVPAMIGLAAVCAIQVNGKPVAQVGAVMKKIPWNIIVFTTALLTLSANLSSEATGIVTFIRNVISPVTGNLPHLILLIVAVLITTVMTNMISNTVSMSMMFSIVAPLLVVSGGIIPPLGLGIVLCCAANMAFLMAPSSTYCVLFFGEHFEIRDTIRYNLFYMVSGVILIITVAYPLANFFGA